MGTQTMELAPEEIVTPSSPEPPAADEAVPVGDAPASASASADEDVLPRGRRSKFSLLATFLPVATAGIALAVDQLVPNRQNAAPTGIYAGVLIGVMIAFVLLGLTQRFWRRMRPTRWNFPIAAVFNLLHWFVSSAPIVGVGMLLLCAWELITLKLNLLPLPYFPGPDGVLSTLVEDWRSAGLGQPGLAQCMTQSLILLMGGFLTGSVIGIVCGVLIGWFAPVRYWGMPVLKLIGPIPATALIPMALMLFPNATLSAVSLIAMAVWFPVTMLTLSGVSNTRASYLDVARTLGAGRAYLVFRVAIPAAMPSIFVGLFMGLGAAFLTLIVAEAVGVQAGLGWYIDWARAYSDYTKVYAALVIMSIYFSTIMTLLFKVRDHVLVWQKGTIKW
jgi:NitT/TauT family transport system permease protein